MVANMPERGRDFPDLSGLRGSEDRIARLARAYETARLSLIAIETGEAARARAPRFSEAELRTTLFALGRQISARLGR